MRFVDDDEVPLHCGKSLDNLVALQEVDAPDHEVAFRERVPGDGGFDLAPPDDVEGDLELLRHFVLPLTGEVRRADDQATLQVAPEHEFTDQQPGHDRFAGAGVIGQQVTQWLVGGASLRRPPRFGVAAAPRSKYGPQGVGRRGRPSGFVGPRKRGGRARHTVERPLPGRRCDSEPTLGTPIDQLLLNAPAADLAVRQGCSGRPVKLDADNLDRRGC